MNIEKMIINSKIEEIKYNELGARSIRRSNIDSIGFRLFKDGFIGISSKIGNFDENVLFKKAKKELQYKIPYDTEISSNLNKKISNKLVINSGFENEISNFHETFKSRYENFNVSFKVQKINNTKTLSNDKKLFLEHSDNHIIPTIFYKDIKSTKSIDGIFYTKTRNFNTERLIKYFDEVYESYDNMIKLTSGVYPLFFLFGSDQILEKFQKELNGNIYGNGNSLFNDEINKLAFNKNFSLSSSHDPLVTYSSFFDDEGHINENFNHTLIENGKILNPYTSKVSAKKFNLKHTGDGHSTFDSVPSNTHAYFNVSETDNTILDIIQNKKAIAISLAAGGSFTPEGNYSSPVQHAYLIENGKIIGRLPQFSISSNLFNMFGKDFLGCAKQSFYDGEILKTPVMNMNVVV